ncbi:hypothetical protein MAR_008226 [Mya arenaria]|uniref:Uncharacterized protein n=1 Tax=Mya arenaria TaxID=6604 RepID=A0ABY7DVD0_MYAAR|nr:hypothetical protein MAR_008199 [Mya arenaria]WAR01668.1 hypothetical protein MAR_008226 [Mya arenaria]
MELKEKEVVRKLSLIGDEINDMLMCEFNKTTSAQNNLYESQTTRRSHDVKWHRQMRERKREQTVNRNAER